MGRALLFYVRRDLNVFSDMIPTTPVKPLYVIRESRCLYMTFKREPTSCPRTRESSTVALGSLDPRSGLGMTAIGKRKQARAFSMLLRRSRGLLGLMVLLLIGIGCRQEEPTPERPPNVVILFADDLGYGDLSSYGHPTIHTPNLDRMAAEGLKLTSFYTAAPMCSPARAALLTGRYPLRASVPHVLGPESEHGLPPEEITIAELLKPLGYRTAMFGKWHLGAQPGLMPTDQGFDEYLGLLYSNDMIPPWVQTERPLELWRNTEPIEHPVDQSRLTVRYTEEAVRFIQESGETPFFLYLPYSMPHVPLAVADELAGRSGGGPYGDVIEAIDWSAGEILAALAAAGVDEHTLVVFTSDNGPWTNMPDRMFSEGLVQRWDAGTTGPLRGHKHSTYEGGVRVPGIMRWPGRIAPGQVSAEMATTLDLFPTIAALTEANLPAGVALDGYDVGAFLFDGAASPRTEFAYQRGRRLEAVRNGSWKLRVDPGTGAVELFDLEVDPYELYNVAADHPDEVTRLLARLDKLAAEMGADLTPVVME